MITVASGSAQADDPSDEERARALFFEAHEAADAGDLEHACKTFAASLALFRRGSTLLNLGRCHRGLGQLASALAHFEEAAALLEQGDPRLEEAQAQVEELQRLAPRVTIRLPDELPSTLRISLDDRFVATHELAVPLRLDAGEHRLTTEADGYDPRVTSFTVKDGDDRVVVLELGERQLPLPPPAPPALLPPPLPPVVIVPAPPPDTGLQVPTWSWVTGALGIAAVAGSIPLYVDYRHVVDRQLELCGGSLEACDPTPPGSYDPGPDNQRRDRDLGFGTGLVVLGGGAIAAAIIGVVLAPEDDDVVVDARGLSVRF